MASIEVGPLAHNLDEEDLAAIEEAFEDADIELALEEDAESRLIDGDIDEVLFEEFLDRLDANNLACDIYVAGDFDDVIEVGEYRVGCASALIALLEELRNDIFEEDEEEEAEEEAEDEEEGFLESFDENEELEESEAIAGGDMSGDYMRYLWKTLLEAARLCMAEETALYLRR
jgi:hypothetical protein